MGMQTLHWKIDPELKRDAEENYRTRFAIGLKDRPALDIIRELTFDGVVPKITIQDIERLFDYVEHHFLKRKIAGVGVEVGAGPLTFSSVLANRPAVRTMYGVEICEPIVELLAPKIASFVLEDRSDKAVGVVGSFDEMELPDQSIDFVFDFFSLHHSLDIKVTLKELSRVLRPGGFVLCFDKARPDHYTDKDLDELLDKVYPESYNRQFGLPLDQKITRRLNGEREYRLKDWCFAFDGAGFSRFEHYNLQQTKGTGITGMIKRMIGVLPPSLQGYITKLLPAPKQNHKFVLSSDHRVFSLPADAFRKEISLMVAYK